MPTATSTDTAPCAARETANAFSPPPPTTIVAGRPATMAPDTVLAAHCVTAGTQVYGSPRRYLPDSLHGMARLSAERMQGAAEILNARSYQTGCEPDHGLLFVAQGLFDEAHLLRAALARDLQGIRAEEAADEQRDAARRAKRATKPAAKARKAVRS